MKFVFFCVYVLCEWHLIYEPISYHTSTRQFMTDNLKSMFIHFQTERLKQDIRSKVLMSDIEDVFDRPAFNQTAVKLLLDNVRMVKENTTRAVSSLETVLYLIRPMEKGDSLKYILGVCINSLYAPLGSLRISRKKQLMLNGTQNSLCKLNFCLYNKYKKNAIYSAHRQI